MRERLRRHASLSLALLAVAGCGATHSDPRAHAGTPVDARHCNDLPFLHGDPGLLVGKHWSSGRHRWDEAVTVYACADPGLGGSVRMSAVDSRIRIQPGEIQLATSSAGVYRFEITPSPGSSGDLLLEFAGPDGKVFADDRGPRVAAEGDGWHFVPVD